MQTLLERIKKLVGAKSTDPDLARREFILNILLISALFLVFVGFCIHVIFWGILHDDPKAYANSTIPIPILSVIFIFLVELYILSRRGFARFSSYALLGVFFLLSLHMTYRWGVDVPAALLFYVMTIVMSGILIHSRFAFIVTLAICASLEVVGQLEWNGAITVNRYWMTDAWDNCDVIMTSIVFMIISTVTWLSNREIEKSLRRARGSEAALKVERDSLEVKVEERTRELRETQLEKMTQLNRFAEFGRLSSGLFHDLMNPLNAVTLNMEMVKNEERGVVEETKKYLNKAILASKKMEDFVVAVRKQIANEENKTVFSVTEETRQVIEVLLYKATKAKVEMSFSASENIEIFGSASKWGQVALNLASNSIDAYLPSADKKRTVAISLFEKGDTIVFSVVDCGSGIAQENLEKIFEPFFTTKEGAGTGLGLYTVKRIVENDFHGTIEVMSEPNKGTTFTIKIPKQNG